MTVPAWVITGLLDSGKTTLINRLIEEKLDELDILVLQFESGETPLTEQERVKKLVFSKSQLERAPLDIADTVIEYLNSHSTELILIEWNGMEHFHKLEEMFLQFMAKTVMSIEKVVYVAADTGIQAGIPDAGAAAFSQIAGSDCAYIRSEGREHGRVKPDLLYNCSPDIRVYTDRKWERFMRDIFHVRMQPQHFLLMAAAAAVLFLLTVSSLDEIGFSFGRYISVYLGVFLQAAPFLLIGVLLSSLIQVCLKPDWIQRKFPEKILAGQLFAVIAGFCLPVCDCASIPVFKSLVK